MILKCHTVDVFATGDHSQHSVVTANLHLGCLGKKDTQEKKWEKRENVRESEGKEIYNGGNHETPIHVIFGNRANSCVVMTCRRWYCWLTLVFVSFALKCLGIESRILPSCKCSSMSVCYCWIPWVMGKGNGYTWLYPETVKISNIKKFPFGGMSGFVCKDTLHRNKSMWESHQTQMVSTWSQSEGNLWVCH